MIDELVHLLRPKRGGEVEHVREQVGGFARVETVGLPPQIGHEAADGLHAVVGVGQAKLGEHSHLLHVLEQHVQRPVVAVLCEARHVVSRLVRANLAQQLVGRRVVGVKVAPAAGGGRARGRLLCRE